MNKPLVPLVLLIDDSITEQRLLVELLKKNEFRLAIALDGMDGYRKALLNAPDLILLDVTMPGVDGFGVCRMLKSNPQTQHIPVIFLTALNQPEQRVEGLRLGAVDYIPKPFSTDEEVLMRIRLHLPKKTVPMPVAEALSANTSDEPVALSALVQLAVDYLLRDLADAPTPAQLARLVGSNETTLNTAFQNELKLPVFRYLREMRLKHAYSLLTDTDIPIRLISEHVGYLHSGNFTTAFRQRYGKTPGQVRAMRTGAAGGAGAIPLRYDATFEIQGRGEQR